MSRMKQIFAKRHKTRDRDDHSADQKYDAKIDNFMKYGKKEHLNDKMHNVIKETSNGMGFI